MWVPSPAGSHQRPTPVVRGRGSSAAHHSPSAGDESREAPPPLGCDSRWDLKCTAGVPIAQFFIGRVQDFLLLLLSSESSSDDLLCIGL